MKSDAPTSVLSRERRSAKAGYVQAGQTLTEIASELGKSASTVARWKREATRTGDCWDRARAVHRMQQRDEIIFALISDFVSVHQETVETLKSSTLPVEDKAKLLATLATAFSKTMNAAGRAAPDLNRLVVAQDVIQRMAKYVQNHFPQHGPALLEILEPFGQELAERYG